MTVHILGLKSNQEHFYTRSYTKCVLIRIFDDLTFQSYEIRTSAECT